jgi:type I restriction enzyme M protein
MVELVGPQPGDRIYDPCFGTAGFLVESADFMLRHRPNSGSAALAVLQHNTFYGIEQKPLTYLLGAMNLLLHGIEGAGLELANTLELHQGNVPESRKYQVILANPPYGGRLSRGHQGNFTIPSGATEVLFLQHIMSNLAVGGRAAVIVPEGVMFRGGADAKVREKLVNEFDLHTILSLPAGCFYPYTGVKTNVLYFDRPLDGRTTSSVWFYELTHDGFELKQTRRPVAGNQLPDFLLKQKARAAGETSWSVPFGEIAAKNWDLTAKNPYRPQDGAHASALELVQSMRGKEERILELLQELEVVLGNGE